MCTMSSSVCLPHADTEKGLSSAEIEAALHVMINRVMRVGFRNYSVLPVREKALLEGDLD